MLDKIKKSIDKFNLNLKGKVVLTEACNGIYSCTAIIADFSGAKRVYALAKETKYGNFYDIENNFKEYFENNLKNNILIIKSLDEINEKIDIVTNSGFLRPINKKYLPFLNNESVISLMYEPWEFRESDIDIALMNKNKIKIYGTNEHDVRLKTMDYIGLTVLYHLLDYKISYFSNKKILILGNYEFTEPIERVLIENHYKVKVVNKYDCEFKDYDYDVFVVAEHKNKQLLIGPNKAYINKFMLDEKSKVIHICGNVDFKSVKFEYKPQSPASFGYMSYRTDFIDDMALIDLQTSSLKVAEGMIKANELNLQKKEYKVFMENNYPALSFENETLW